MENQRIQLLLDKYHKGICTEEELAELDAWYETLDADYNERLPESIYENADYFLNQKFESFEKRVKKKGKLHIFRPWIKVAAAAIIVLGIGTELYVTVTNKNRGSKQVALNDVPPGQSGAVLTLSDGSKVVLDSTGNGTVATQNGVQVIKSSGQLSYASSGKQSSAVTYNTLSTPKARRYNIVLPDGTKVWLNASSSISYPVAFTGKERKVKVTGEAYFEVVHNSAIPFKVIAGNAEITDVGTHFNVYAYNDEVSIKTTLLEGAVKVGDKTLKPGQQAQVSKDYQIKIVQLPEAEDVIAWKNGEISFDNVDVATLMRQLSRWYDVDIVFTNGVPDGHLIGTVSIQTNLSTVIKVLNFYGIHCSIEGKKLIVAP